MTHTQLNGSCVNCRSGRCAQKLKPTRQTITQFCKWLVCAYAHTDQQCFAYSRFKGIVAGFVSFPLTFPTTSQPSEDSKYWVTLFAVVTPVRHPNFQSPCFHLHLLGTRSHPDHIMWVSGVKRCHFRRKKMSICAKTHIHNSVRPSLAT